MKYVIRNKNSSFYFEQDFAGWSWQESVEQAKKFRNKDDAEFYAGWLNASDFPCKVEEFSE